MGASLGPGGPAFFLVAGDWRSFMRRGRLAQAAFLAMCGFHGGRQVLSLLCHDGGAVLGVEVMVLSGRMFGFFWPDVWFLLAGQEAAHAVPATPSGSADAELPGFDLFGRAPKELGLAAARLGPQTAFVECPRPNRSKPAPVKRHGPSRTTPCPAGRMELQRCRTTTIGRTDTAFFCRRRPTARLIGPPLARQGE